MILRASESYLTGWCFGTWSLFFHILGIIIPTDKYFSEGLKPPTSYLYQISSTVFVCYLGQSSKRRKWASVQVLIKKQLHICIARIFSKHGYVSKKSTQRHALIPGRVTLGLLWNPKLGTSRWPMQPVKVFAMVQWQELDSKPVLTWLQLFFAGCDYGILDQAS